jgi:hypothetical protein
MEWDEGSIPSDGMGRSSGPMEFSTFLLHEKTSFFLLKYEFKILYTESE